MAKKVKRSLETPRISVSFPPDVYSELQRIAEAKKVSTAWVVREAATRYIADQWPLLSGRLNSQGST
jgi:hypothetical protein